MVSDLDPGPGGSLDCGVVLVYTLWAKQEIGNFKK